tara:strand:- start:71 stop:940 length:870 start_codon:yes stop_codon:yes gene_type:complete
MVFEQIVKLSWIERKENAFFLGLIYTLLALFSSRLIFPRSMGLMSVAFTSILLIPSLNVLLAQEENQEVREKKLSIKLFWKDHNDVLKVYVFVFLGIFIGYLIFGAFYDTNTLFTRFEPQLNAAQITSEFIPFAQNNPYECLYTLDLPVVLRNPGFLRIVRNNLLIFVVSFILSLIYGAGAVLFITWNASVWGVVFGFIAKKASSVAASNSISAFTSQIIPFLPHMVTEASAYVIAAIMGGILSKAIIREKIGTKKFNHILTDALMVLIFGMFVVFIAGIIEVAAGSCF